MEPLIQPPVAAVDGAAVHKVNTWFFMCGPLSFNVFLFGLALNLRVFQRHDLAFDKVMDMRRDEVPTAGGVAGFATGLLAVQFALFGVEAWRRGDAFGVDEVQMELLLVLYCFLAIMALCWPFDILHRKARYFALRRLGRCLWPFQDFSLHLPAHPTPFVEVFLADGLTSLSKFIQDSAVAWMLLSLSFTQEMDALQASYVTKMKSSPLPYFAASMPYMIRATQCLISFQRTSSANDRFLHLLNTLKYCSSLLVISVGAYPQIMGYASVRLDKNSLFLFCAVFNSLYSFLWDVIMDWGLGQPKLPKRVRFLRHQLLYRPRSLYYVVIVFDFLLRILWVTKWWNWNHYGVDFKMLSMLAEVVRRCVWNVLRVEWQCIKLEILGGKKLSEDSMELEQSMENMPLMADDNDDDDADGDSGAAHAAHLPSDKTLSEIELGAKRSAHHHVHHAHSGASSLQEPRSSKRDADKCSDDDSSPLCEIELDVNTKPKALSPVKSDAFSSRSHHVKAAVVTSSASRSSAATTALHRKPHASGDDADESFGVPTVSEAS